MTGRTGLTIVYLWPGWHWLILGQSTTLDDYDSDWLIHLRRFDKYWCGYYQWRRSRRYLNCFDYFSLFYSLDDGSLVVPLSITRCQHGKMRLLTNVCRLKLWWLFVLTKWTSSCMESSKWQTQGQALHINKEI